MWFGAVKNLIFTDEETSFIEKEFVSLSVFENKFLKLSCPSKEHE